jgi:hypothetical protein
MHLTTGSLVRLYPRPWRDRYGDEMQATIEAGPVRARDRLDLIRGALDAWLHPPARSRIPARAALIGGGLWTVAAARVVSQPVPPDWPGYLEEVIIFGLAAAGLLLVATLGCAFRLGDTGGRAMRFAVVVTSVGYIAWMTMLAATALGHADGPTLAVVQTLAMVGTTLVGAVLARAGDELVGELIMIGAIVMLIPWTVMWLAFGAAWTAVGIVLEMERSRSRGARSGLS